MCGRARCTLGVDDVGRACGFRAPLRSIDSDRFNPSFNVTPGRYMPVVRHATQGGNSATDQQEPVVQSMKWGLVPNFSKKSDKPDHFRMFNARSESVQLKSSFNRLLPKSRCLTAVEGFYEWKKDGGKSQPYYVHFKDGRPLVFAGLYDTWKDEEGNTLYTFTILTTRSSKAFDWLHDRMPVILPSQESINSWLNDDLKEPLSLHKLTQPYEASDLTWYPVTAAMGKPMFDNPECVKEIKPKVASDSKIAQLFGKAHKKHDTDAGPAIQVGEEVLEDEIIESSRVEEDEDSTTDYERQALLAGLEPDQDISQSVQKGQEISRKVNFKGEESDTDWVLFESLPENEKAHGGKQAIEVLKRTRESRSVKLNGRDSPPTKLSRSATSPIAVKKAETELSSNKQPTLLSFFGKQ